ncbi:hypothetical protein G6F31_018028 [Rhizopus arrhizus]|nr:hypothetical protein G6F31_018028 [Rhizopus arrhizus]
MMDEPDVQRILKFGPTMIGSDGLPHDERPHPRRGGTFPRVLGHYSRDLGLFPLETAVWKMTGLTAAKFGLAERGQVQVLLVAQVGHGKAADRLHVIRVLGADHGAAFQIDAGAGHVGAGHVGDVFTAIAAFRPAVLVWCDALDPGLGGQRQVLDLHAGIVVVELALGVPAIGIEHAGHAVADRRGAAVADVQRAGCGRSHGLP